MPTPSTSDTSITLIIIEGAFTFLAVAVAFCLPGLGNSFFARIERTFAQLARRKTLSVFLVGLTALLLRLAIIPLCPIPVPFVPDDFSFMLAADTFAHGHLANPTPAMWMHFETIHVTMLPTYMSMYFPAQGLVLALGKVLFGNPWYGLLIGSTLMCATICWMLQAWLPATWALLGGIVAILHLGLFSYWINTYHAAASIAALGGALVLGSLPRLKKNALFRYGLLMSIGMVLMALARPYEGVLLCLPVLIDLVRWMLFDKRRPAWGVLARRAVLPLLIIVAGVSWLGYYDSKAFGKATTLPYTIDRATYAMAPYFVWQSARPEPVYRHAAMRSFYYVGEMDFFTKIHNLRGFLPQTFLKFSWVTLFYAGTLFLPALFMMPRVCRDRRLRFLVISMAILFAGMLIQIYLIPHYLAPFTAAIYALGLQAIRHLRQWRPEGRAAGKTLVRLSVTLTVVMVGLRLFVGPLHIGMPKWPATYWNFQWYGPDHFGTDRARVEDELSQLPGKQLVLVRYGEKHNPFEEWVYNAADIDHSKVIWARDMDAASNAELIRYYKDRQVWLVEPDHEPATRTPYPEPSQLLAATR